MHAAIICSELDAASQNVARHLLKRVPWARCSEGPVQWTYGNFQLLVTKGRLIKQEALGRELNADLLIFASRHQSEKRKGPVFTAHFTGNIEGSQQAVSYTHLRAHETVLDLVCRLLLEKKK